MRLGVVGTSLIVEKFMVAVGYFPTIELKAVMSPNQHNVNRFVEKYNFENGYTNFDELISKSKLDLLYIASPNSFHFKQTKKALKNNINLLCEKPITLSLEELKELEQIARENNVFFMEAMRTVHHPNKNLVKEALNELDTIQFANFHFMQYSSKYDAYKDGKRARVFTPEYGGGALNDLGVYPITLAILLFGKPQKVSVDYINLESGVDATTTVSLNYGSFICNCTFSKVSNSYSYNEIQGEKKSLLLNHVTFLEELILVDDEKRKVLIHDSIKDDMRFELETFMNIIKNRDYNKYTKFLSISKDVAEICDEIRKSM